MLVLVLLWLAAPVDGAPATDWKPVKPADGTFSASMPAEPRLTSTDIPSGQGTFHRDTYTCKSDGVAFVITATRFSMPIPDESREAILDREAAEYGAEKRAEVVRFGQIAVEGRPGWDMTLRLPAPGPKPGVTALRCRAVLAGQTLYHVSVTSAIDKPLPGSAARFIRSFRFTPRPAGAVDDATPERATRAFLLAVANRDEEQLDAVTLPVDGLEWLLGGVPSKPAQLAAARKAAANQPIRVLKVGDEFTLADGQKEVVPPVDVADDRAVLLPQGAPAPIRLRKVEGHWKVDPHPLIEARQAAAAARGKAKPKPKKGSR